jgi:hypothetical protein
MFNGYDWVILTIFELTCSNNTIEMFLPIFQNLPKFDPYQILLIRSRSCIITVYFGEICAIQIPL